MERIAVLSDVHGNLTAIKSVIADIEAKGIRKIYCLGDSVVKCAHPSEVVDFLREKCTVILKGNCDETICRPGIEPGKFWSRDRLGEERASFIYNCPIYTEFYLSGHLVRLFHASPFALDFMYNPMYENTDNPYYQDKLIKHPGALFANTEFLGKIETDPIPDIIGYGHLHTPNLFRFQNKTIFNCGSVGIPIEMLNENPEDNTNYLSTMASYMILEGNFEDKNLGPISFSLVRLPYDISKEIADLENSDMPNKNIIIKSLKTAIH